MKIPRTPMGSNALLTASIGLTRRITFGRISRIALAGRPEDTTTLIMQVVIVPNVGHSVSIFPVLQSRVKTFSHYEKKK